jgi:hypothetical protein
MTPKIREDTITLSVVITIIVLAVILVASAVSSRLQPGQYEAESMSRTTGQVKIDLGSSWVRKVCGITGQGGALTYGPYIWYDPGSYNVTFYLTQQAPANTSLGKVDVAVAKSDVILASQDIKTNTGDNLRHTITLTFTLMNKSMLEFRTWYYGQGVLCVDKVSILKTDQ